MWLMNGESFEEGRSLPWVTDSDWTIRSAADFERDGYSDLVWRNQATGENYLWLMGPEGPHEGRGLPFVPPGRWDIVAPR